MAEEKLFKLPIVKSDAIINIQVSGTFLKKCQTLLLAIGEEVGKDKIKTVMEKFQATNTVPEDTTEAMIFTLTALVGEMENEAIKQEQVEYQEMTADQLRTLYYPNGN
jgi:hypothetical protein